MNYGNTQHQWDLSIAHGMQGAIDTNIEEA